MKYLFLVLIISSSALATDKKLLPPKTTKLKAKSEIFDHPEIQDSCEVLTLCEKAAVNYCSSAKAKFLRCSEQYKDNWILTCVCL